MANTMNVTGQLILQVSDGTTNAVVFNRNLGNPTISNVVNSGTQFRNLPDHTVNNTIDQQGIVTLYFLYVKNDNATGNITVSMKATGGSEQVLPSIQPGGCLVWFGAATGASTPSGSGCVEFKLQGSADNMVVEYGFAGN
jgi:hypothetical protein